MTGDALTWVTFALGLILGAAIGFVLAQWQATGAQHPRLVLSGSGSSGGAPGSAVTSTHYVHLENDPWFMGSLFRREDADIAWARLFDRDSAVSRGPSLMFVVDGAFSGTCRIPAGRSGQVMLFATLIDRVGFCIFAPDLATQSHDDRFFFGEGSHKLTLQVGDTIGRSFSFDLTVVCSAGRVGVRLPASMRTRRGLFRKVRSIARSRNRGWVKHALVMLWRSLRGR